MKKAPWTQHPIFYALVGAALAALYIFLEALISPPMSRIFGAAWEWLKPLQFAVVCSLATKAFIWQQMPRSIAIEPISAADFAGVPQHAETFTGGEGDRFALLFAQFQTRTRELEDLGFVLQKEGAVRSDKNTAPTFARLLLHPDGSWAELFQAFPRGVKPTPLALAFVTDFERDWQCTDGTLKANWAMWLLRPARVQGKSHAPEASAANIWQNHRERSAKLHQITGLRGLKLSAEQHLEQDLAATRRGLDAIWFRSVLVAMLRSAFARRGRENWREAERYAKQQNR